MGFDRLASCYRCLERLVFGNALQKARLERLDEVLAANSVLLLGDGDGRFLEALLVAGCEAEIVSVDASLAMLERARRRVGDSGGRVRFVHARVEEFEPPDGFCPDLVVAQFFFDCFTDAELGVIVRRIAAWASPAGKLLLTDFALPDGGILRRLWARLLLWKMLVFFRLFAGISARGLPDFGAALRAGDFLREDRRERRRGLVIFSERWGLEAPGERS